MRILFAVFTVFLLLIPELLPDEILQLIPELKAQKQQVNEKAVMPLPEKLYNFYIEQKEQTLQRVL